MSLAPSPFPDDARGRLPASRGVAALRGHHAALLAAAIIVFVGVIVAFLSTRHTVTIIADGHTTVLRTNARTVLAALQDAHISLDPADVVSPDRHTAVTEGLIVAVERAKPVELDVDGDARLVRTQAATVADVLAETGVQLAPGDVVLVRGVPVAPVTPLTDLLTGSLVASTQGAVERPQTTAREGSRNGDDVAGETPQLEIRRAVTMTVHDGGTTTTINTAAETVGEALQKAGINVYLADVVRPDVQTPVQANLNVFIQRSKEITIVSDDPEIAPHGSFVTRTQRATLGELLADEGLHLTGREEVKPALDQPARHGTTLTIRRFHPLSIEVDGRVVATKTKEATIRQVLADENIPLGPLDKVSPPLDAEPTDNVVVKVVRVREATVEEEEEIPFETIASQPSAEIELDHTGYQAGEPGIKKRQFKVTYENGLPVNKVLLKEWVAKEPVPEIHFYGTKIVLREVQTPQGPKQYWRKLTVLATYYHNSTTGKTPDDPEYGITRTGTPTRPGTIATDPDVIPLWTNIYVPGYGVGTALDTGGGIIGKHIDVYMPEGDSSWGVRYPEIYLLTPVPDWYPLRLP